MTLKTKTLTERVLLDDKVSSIPNSDIALVIDGTLINSWSNIIINRENNKINDAQVKGLAQDSDTRDIISETSDVKIFIGSNLEFKGRIDSINYRSGNIADLKIAGAGVNLRDRVTSQIDHIDQAADAIVDDSVSGSVEGLITSSIISTDTVESAPDTTLRFHNDDLATAITDVANSVGFDWYISQKPSENWDTNYFNFVSDRGITRSEIDNFEDQSTSGWSGDTGAFTTTTDSDKVITGSASAVLSASNTANEVTSPSTTNAEGTVRAKIDPRGQTDTSGDTVEFKINWSEAVDPARLIFDDSNGKIRWDPGGGGSASDITTSNRWSAEEVQEILVVVNFEKSTANVKVNSGHLGEQDVDSSVTSISDVSIKNDTSNSGNSRDVIVDDFGWGNVLDFTGKLSRISQDRDGYEVSNDVTYTGYGQGDDEIEARVFAATTKFTPTTEKLSAGDTTSVSVEDASQLGSDGDSVDVRIGSEVVSGTLDTTGDSINISSRGQNDFNGNSTEDIDHYKDVMVWLKENSTQGDGPFSPDSPESDSSIDDFGIREHKESESVLIKKSTLEKLADKEIRSRRDKFRRIKVSVPDGSMPLDPGDEIWVRELSSLDIDQKFSVVSFERDITENQMDVKLSNREVDLSTELKKIKDTARKQNSFDQGARNVWGDKEAGNASNPEPLLLDFYIPEDVEDVSGKNRISNVFVNYSLSPFRQNSSSSDDRMTSTTRVTQKTLQSADISSSDVTIQGDDLPGNTATSASLGRPNELASDSSDGVSIDSYSNVFQSAVSAADDDVPLITCRLEIDISSSSDRVRIRMELHNNGSIQKVAHDKVHRLSSNFSFNQFHLTYQNDDPTGPVTFDEVQVDMHDLGGSNTVGSLSGMTLLEVPKHSHSVTTLNHKKSSDSSKYDSDSVGHGDTDMDEVTGDNDDTTVVSVDDDLLAGNKATELSSIEVKKRGGSFSTVQSNTGTTEDQRIDISSEISGSGWYTLKLKPDQATYVKGRVFFDHHKDTR